MPSALSSSVAIALSSAVLVPAATRAELAPRQINIQPIAICSDANTGCADASGLIAATQTATEAIWSQAGITVSFLPPENLDDSRSLTTAIDINGATDQGRQLMRDPGHGQSSNPQVLNMYFVPNLTDATGQTTPYAFSFTNGNGMIIGPTPRLDTIAHEIGHNLGLDHTTLGAGAPDNLMTDGTIRSIPASLADITSGKDDVLDAAQLAQARSPTFSVGQFALTAAVAPYNLTADNRAYFERNGPFDSFVVLSPTAYPALTPSLGDGGFIDAFSPVASMLPAETLQDVKIRFFPGTQTVLDRITQQGVWGDVDAFGPFVTDPRTICDAVFCSSPTPFDEYAFLTSRSTLADGTIQFEWNLANPATLTRDLLFSCPLPLGQYCSYTQVPTPSAPPAFSPYDRFFTTFAANNAASSPAPTPFSALFTFSDGSTSQGFYDAATGTISTTAPTSVTTWAPGSLPLLDAANTVPDTALATVSAEIEVAVAEPATWLVLTPVVLLAAGVRSRRAPTSAGG